MVDKYDDCHPLYKSKDNTIIFQFIKRVFLFKCVKLSGGNIRRDVNLIGFSTSSS